MLEFEASQYQKAKLGIHIAQGALTFVAWILEIVVFKSTDSVVEGRTGWYFGLCFLTMPALIFLTMTPRFPRTRKLANPYAMATIDGLFCLLWLSAFAAQASYNSADKCGDGCTVSKVVVAFGVIIWLLFVLTTWLSLYGVFYFKKNGYLPGASRGPANASVIDPDKDAFSTAPHDDEYVPVQNMDHDHDDLPGPLSHGGYGGNHSDANYDAPPYGAYAPPTVSDDTGYHPGAGYGGAAETAYGGAGANTGYMGATGRQSPVIGADGRVQFPAARYDHV